MKKSSLEMAFARARCQGTSLEWAFDIQVLGESIEAKDQQVDGFMMFGLWTPASIPEHLPLEDEGL